MVLGCSGAESRNERYLARVVLGCGAEATAAPTAATAVFAGALDHRAHAASVIALARRTGASIGRGPATGRAEAASATQGGAGGLAHALCAHRVHDGVDEALHSSHDAESIREAQKGVPVPFRIRGVGGKGGARAKYERLGGHAQTVARVARRATVKQKA